MFGPKLNTVFASRWRALWWSAAVLITTYLTVPGDDQASDPEAANLAEVSQALQQVNANIDKNARD